MTDFHTSLDRALDGERDYFAPEPIENPSGIPPLPNSWVTLGYVDEIHDWPASPLRDLIDLITDRETTAYDDLQERINAAIIRRDDHTITFRVNPVEPKSFDFLRYGSPEWQRYLDLDAALEPDGDEPVAYDGFGAPLYAHQIPAEGTE